MKELSRRAILTAVGLGGAAALSGCGLANSSRPAATATATSRSVKNVDGSAVNVPTNPKRVVTLSEPTTDAILALGLKPIGVVAGRGQKTVPSYLSEKAKNIPIMGSIGQPNFEAIGAQKPDLILVDGTGLKNNAKALATLRAIAPTVYTGDAGGDWRSNFTNIANALNQEQKGKQVLAAYDKRVKEMASALAPKYSGKTFSIIRWQGTAAALILKELPAGVALNDLGLKRPASQDRKGHGHSEPVSLENISQIDADYMFFGFLAGSSVSNPKAGGSADTSAATKALQQAAQVPGFAELGAYKAGHVYPVDGSVWTSTGSAILMNSILDDVKRHLLS